METGLPRWVAANQQTVVCNDVTSEPRYAPLPGFDACAQLAVPVVVKDEVVAVLSVQAMEPQVFDDSDGKTLETLADQLAVAIGNVQLLDQQQEQSRRLAVAEERDRIGRYLHDGVIQSIYAVGLNLEDIASQPPSNAGQNAGPSPSGRPTDTGELDELRERIGDVVGDLNRVIGDIRNYIMDLRPGELQGRPLDEALASLIQYLKDRTGVSVELETNLNLSGLSQAHTVNLWHIFQETFSNIEKYAKASKVTVSIKVCIGQKTSGGRKSSKTASGLRASEGRASGGRASGGRASGGRVGDEHLALVICDDGIGFDPEQAELGRGYGLSNIKDRAERLGGTLIMDSSPGAGSSVQVQFPLNHEDQINRDRSNLQTGISPSNVGEPEIERRVKSKTTPALAVKAPSKSRRSAGRRSPGQTQG